MFKPRLGSPFHHALTWMGEAVVFGFHLRIWNVPDGVSVLFPMNVHVFSPGFAYCRITWVLLVTGWPLGSVRVPVISLILLPPFGTYGLLSTAVRVGV